MACPANTSLEGKEESEVHSKVFCAWEVSGQKPLLAADLPAGLVVATARRSHECLAWFNSSGPRPQPVQQPEDGGSQEQPELPLAGVCALLVSETALVHYTLRPRKSAARASCAPEVISEPPVDEKYWKRRFNYFARFDEGI
ncbi:unnamed protein product, partial [Polarella glacialis]